MKKLIVMLSCLILILAFGCGKAERKIVKENGVEVILNGKRPDPPEGIATELQGVTR